VSPKDGDESTPRIFGFVSGPPTGVAGEPDDVGEAALEKLGEGVSGVLGSADQDAFDSVEGVDFADDVGSWREAKVGIGLALFDFSLMGVFEVEASARAARLETKVVG